jgi:hypothetical protein
MPELTHLDEKLAEVLGLAQAAQVASTKVATLARQGKDTELLELFSMTCSSAPSASGRCWRPSGPRPRDARSPPTPTPECRHQLNQ